MEKVQSSYLYKLLIQDERNMSQILVPTLGESVSEATVAKWLKKEGEAVAADEPIVELETDKVTLEVNAPAAGTIIKISKNAGSAVKVGEILGEITAGSAANTSAKPAPAPVAAPTPAAAPAAEKLSPAVQKITADNNINAADISGTGKDGRVTKGDVINHMASPAPVAAPKAPAGPARGGGGSIERQ